MPLRGVTLLPSQSPDTFNGPWLFTRVLDQPLIAAQNNTTFDAQLARITKYGSVPITFGNPGSGGGDFLQLSLQAIYWSGFYASNNQYSGSGTINYSSTRLKFTPATYPNFPRADGVPGFVNSGLTFTQVVNFAGQIAASLATSDTSGDCALALQNGAFTVETLWAGPAVFGDAVNLGPVIYPNVDGNSWLHCNSAGLSSTIPFQLLQSDLAGNTIAGPDDIVFDNDAINAALAPILGPFNPGDIGVSPMGYLIVLAYATFIILQPSGTTYDIVQLIPYDAASAKAIGNPGDWDGLRDASGIFVGADGTVALDTRRNASTGQTTPTYAAISPDTTNPFTPFVYGLECWPCLPVAQGIR